MFKLWRRSSEKHGNDGFYMERRGKGSSSCPSSKELTVEEKLKKAEARIAFLDMRTTSKKVKRTREAGEEEQSLTLSEKFQMIEETIRKYQLKANGCYSLWNHWS